MSWKHAKLAADAVANTPKLADFFRGGPVRHLVRELTQNTMDNRQNGRAMLRFRFTQPSSPTTFGPYLIGLREHVTACGIGAGIAWENPALLIIEDFGTKGLEGAVDDKRANGSFAKFWWRTGDSNKDAGSSRGGRHGVGKVVNADASKVGAFFGYSVAGSPTRATLLGRSSLKPHMMEGEVEEYQAEGTFYDTLPSDGKPPTPFMNQVANDFAACAGMKRKADERGLSIAILWPKEEFTPTSIREACLQECLYQIAADELQIEIDGELITEATLPAELDKLIAADPKLAYLRATYNLIQAALTTPPEQFIAPEEALDAKVGKLSNAFFSAAQIDAMRIDWAQNKPITVKLKVLVRPKDSVDPKIGNMLVAIQRIPEGDRGWATCVRDDVTVADAVRWSRSAVALLVAKGDALSGFLGDAEGPSHENWLPEYVKETYAYAPQTISAVRTALSNLYEVVMGGEENDTVEGALTEYFAVNEPERKRDKKEPTVNPPPIEPPVSKPTPIKLRRTKNGFKISLTPEGENIAPFDLRVRAAYRVRMSDPFRAYSENDFVFNAGDLTYECEGADKHQANANAIEIQGVGKGFTLAAAGFDPNREVAIAWNVQESESA